MAAGGDVRVAVLGSIEVDDGSGVVALSPQLRRLLGVLVVADGGVVSADRLAEYVADGNVEGSTVRTAVSRLRKVLGDRVESMDGGYRLVLSPDELDAARFEQLVARSRAEPGEVRVAALARAVGLWRGRPFGDLADEEWASAAVSRWEGRRASTTEELAEALLAVGRHREAVEVLDEHVREHPYRERPVGLLMRALAADGRVADGLRVFERCRVVLRNDLGLEPSPELRSVEGELLALGGSQGGESVLPSGTVTFLFTDIEGSTQRWAQDEAAMTSALAAHDVVLREVVGSHGGTVFKHTGDGVCAVFASAVAAVAAAVEAQGRLELPVRMGIHTGEAELRAGDYFGPTLNRVARIMDAGHSGQVLLSQATAALVREVATTDLGQHALKGLAVPERLLQVGAAEFPPPRVAATRQGNLPTETTSFVGRDGELANLVERLTRHRLVTLIGVGGTGKTRLAIEAARAVAPTFPDGCWFAQLAPVAVTEAVPFAVLAGLGIPSPTMSDPVDHLVAQIRHRRLLLIVDNCEHVLSAAADLIEQIIEQCPAVSVLATSREPLLLNGEHLLPIPSLGADDAEQLFAQRAIAEVPHCLADDRQREAAAAICERLDGLPLAIELAASRVRAFTPVELLGMLDERFRVLVGGRRSRMERHQTMRGTLDWSYDLCDEIERSVFDRLSVFPARFTLEQAHHVAGGDDLSAHDVAEAVSSLVDRSLVQTSAGFDGGTRYGLLETMRAYGRDHLYATGELDDVRDRHARYVDDLIPTLLELGPDEEWGARRRVELIADALTALDWFLERREWRRAFSVCRTGVGINEREVWEMIARMHTAMLEAGADDGALRAVRDADVQWKLHQPMAELEEASWQYLRSGETLGEGLAGMEVAPRSVAEFEEALQLIRDRSFEPQRTRFVRTVFVVRHAAQSAVAVPDRVWDEIEEWVHALRSRTAVRFWNDALAWRAFADERWDDALEHFRLALPADDTALGLGWYQIVARWGLADVSALAGRPVDLDHLVTTWEILERHGVTIQRERGCVASAITAAARGHRELADRFMRWAWTNDPGGLMDHFRPILDRAGFEPMTLADETVDDLETLLAELRRAAIAEAD